MLSSTTSMIIIGRGILPTINTLFRVCQCKYQPYSTTQTSSGSETNGENARQEIYLEDVPPRELRRKSLYDMYKTLQNDKKQRPPDSGNDKDSNNLQSRLEKEREKIVKIPITAIAKGLIQTEKSVWTHGSKRVGAIGIKLGMTALWKKDGSRLPVTLVQIKECEVIRVRLSREDGGRDNGTAVLVGAINVKDNDIYKVNRRDYGAFVAHNTAVKKKLASFKVNVDGLLHPGTPITAAHFTAGQKVKIKGISKDKGFQGVMKRWGMKGQPASHGQTKTHRKVGHIGGGKSGGGVWPGKKMPGQMGKKSCTLTQQKVWRINTKLNVLYINGWIPGNNGDLVVIQDSQFEKFEKFTPPFPTFFPESRQPLEEDIYDSEVSRFVDESISVPVSN